jgi:hypothetical protein
MNLGFRAYFVLGGLALLVASTALLIDFRGFGKRWDEDFFAHSKEVIKLTRVPWTANPATGKVWRPYAAIFGIALSIALILTGFFAE